MARAMQVQGVDHFGVETAAGMMRKMRRSARPASHCNDGPSPRPATLLGSGAQVEVPGQKVFVAGGKTVSGSPGTVRFTSFGRSAIAPHGDQGSQTALGEEPVRLAGNFLKIRENRDLKTLLPEKFSEVRDATLGRPCPCLWVNRHDNASASCDRNSICFPNRCSVCLSRSGRP